MKFPYNDDYMIYDYYLHRYRLTEKAYIDYLGINFGELPTGMDANPSAMATREANSVSETVYRFITTDSMNPDWLTFEMATVGKLRGVIFRMLLAQAKYVATSGNMENFSGIDAFSGAKVDRKKIREAIVAPAVEDYAYQVQPCLGRCLKYAGAFGLCPPPYSDMDGVPVW